MNGFREKLRTDERTNGRTNEGESIGPTSEVGGSNKQTMRISQNDNHAYLMKLSKLIGNFQFILLLEKVLQFNPLPWELLLHFSFLSIETFFEGTSFFGCRLPLFAQLKVETLTDFQKFTLVFLVQFFDATLLTFLTFLRYQNDISWRRGDNIIK